MVAKEAQEVAKQLDDIPVNDEKLQAEIHRLNRKGFVPLEQVQTLHDWLEAIIFFRVNSFFAAPSNREYVMRIDLFFKISNIKV